MFTKVQVIELLGELAKKRPIFHSEADFQHEIAWLIHETDPLIHVRLEKPITSVGEVDILLLKGSLKFAIELKYKTLERQYDLCGEVFYLKSHGAQPLGRYDGLKDIFRIEKSKMKGCTIFLTNESQYWNVQPRGNGSQFSLHDGRELKNVVLKWNDNSKTNSIGEGRVSEISIAGSYQLSWRNFGSKSRGFRYLLVMV